MLAAARRATTTLAESADLVRKFVRRRFTHAGGFAGRSDEPDLYYTVFGLECLLALDAPLPTAELMRYLASFGQAADLDFVHTTCLVRCWADLDWAGTDAALRDALAEKLAGFRTADGGFASEPGSTRSSAYGCFLGAGAYEDLARDLPAPDSLVSCLATLRCPDGGYANAPGWTHGMTPSTAAAVCVLTSLGREVDEDTGAWLLGRFEEHGGFLAAPDAPLADLLSTATALHALGQTRADLTPIAPACLDFLDSLWDGQGGFRGYIPDTASDVEYTYYALLAMGHLS